MPICPSGHKLRTVVGYSRPLSLPIAFLVGLLLSCAVLVFGILEDERRVATPSPHLILKLATGAMFLYGAMALCHAWNWAGSNGPVKLLAPRACGMAFGYLVPAVVSSHALYFEWVNPVATAALVELKKLVFGWQ